MHIYTDTLSIHSHALLGEMWRVSGLVAGQGGLVCSVTPVLSFQLGFTLGNVVGMYLAQNYDVSWLCSHLSSLL